MLKKSLLSIAIAASVVGVSGCDISSTTSNQGNVPEVQQQNQAAIANKTYPLFNPARGTLPVGIDLLFADASDSDGTANVGDDQDNPVRSALNDIDGISTLAPIDVQFNAAIDPASVEAGTNVFLVKLPNAEDVGGDADLILPDGVDASSVDALDLASIAPFFATTQADGSAADDSAFAAGEGLPESVAAINLFGANDGVPLGTPEAPTQTDGIIAMQPIAGVDYEVTVIGLDGTDNNTIRISPLKPLDSKTKYIALVTTGVTAADGEAITPSPDYDSVSGTDALVSSALEPVRALVQNIETLSTQIVTKGGTAALSGEIAFSAPFTTTDPDTVLKSMADPGYWAPSVITNNTIADAVITAGGMDPSAVSDAAKIPTAIGVARAALTAPNADLGGATAYEHPRARAFEIIPNVGGMGVDQLSVNALTQSFDTPLTEDVMVSQGAIELPQYTVAFDGADPTTFSDDWDANTTVGAVLDGALGQEAGTTPPTDVNNGESDLSNVTYRFPFAAEKRKAVVPLLMFEPQAGSTGPDGPGGAGCTKPGAGWPVVIIQHGFTSDRTGNLINGAKIADLTCHAVIAMDLPHHGVAPEGSGFGLNVDYAHSTTALTPFAAAKEGYITAAGAENTMLDDLAERHQGFYGVSGVPTPVVYADAEDDRVGDSGSLWIRLDSFQRTRDNLRQAVMDLLNLNASLANIDIDGDGSDGDLDTDKVNYIGHSLGGIVGTNFIATNNSSDNSNLNAIQKAVLATPGGHLTKLIENSVGIGQSVIAGLAGNGITQGSSNFESFMKVFQATVDSGDPMNFISDLSAGGDVDIPTLVVGMYGALEDGGDPSDLVVPISGEGVDLGGSTPVLADGTTPQPETANNPLTGLAPMLDLLGAENIKDSPAGDKYIAKYNEGSHSTFSSAGTRAAEDDDGNVPDPLDSQAAYGEMLNQTVTLLLTGTPTVDTGTLLISDAN